MQENPLRSTTTYPAIVGGVLTQLRNQNGLRQDELAQAVGITQATWSRIERGHTSITVEHLRKVAAKLGTAPGTILNYADQSEISFRSRGGEVMTSRDDKDAQTAAIIAGGALLVIIAAVMMASSKA